MITFSEKGFLFEMSCKLRQEYKWNSLYDLACQIYQTIIESSWYQNEVVKQYYQNYYHLFMNYAGPKFPKGEYNLADVAEEVAAIYLFELNDEEWRLVINPNDYLDRKELLSNYFIKYLIK